VVVIESDSIPVKKTLTDPADTEKRRAEREQRKAALRDMEIVSVDPDTRVKKTLKDVTAKLKGRGFTITGVERPESR
jgi:hypothetical protein